MIKTDVGVTQSQKTQQLEFLQSATKLMLEANKVKEKSSDIRSSDNDVIRINSERGVMENLLRGKISKAASDLEKVIEEIAKDKNNSQELIQKLTLIHRDLISDNK